MSDGGPALAGLAIGDPPERWRALGFAVDPDGRFAVDGVTITLGVAPAGTGIAGWTLSGATGAAATVDGLTAVPASPAVDPAAGAPVDHPNRVVGIDHVVIVTADLERLAAELDAAGLGLRRRRELRGRRMGFRRIGPSIMEIVEEPAAETTRFWGVTFTVAHRSDLDALAAGPLVEDAHDALQPGRRIAAVARGAGLSARVAFMDPGGR